MKLQEAIKVLKDYRKGEFVGDDEFCEAIDTVVAEVETRDQSSQYGNDSNVTSKTYTENDMEAFAEWCDKSIYAFHHKSKIWVSYGMGRMITTAQLREMWEKERRAK